MPCLTSGLEKSVCKIIRYRGYKNVNRDKDVNIKI